MSEEFLESLARVIDPDAWQSADVLPYTSEARKRLLQPSMTKALGILPLIDARLSEAAQSLSTKHQREAERLTKVILKGSSHWNGMSAEEVTQTLVYILKHAETKSLESLVGAGLYVDLGYQDLCAEVADYVLTQKLAEEMNRP